MSVCLERLCHELWVSASVRWAISWLTDGVLNDWWGGWFSRVHWRPWADGPTPSSLYRLLALSLCFVTSILHLLLFCFTVSLASPSRHISFHSVFLFLLVLRASVCFRHLSALVPFHLCSCSPLTPFLLSLFPLSLYSLCPCFLTLFYSSTIYSYSLHLSF